MYRRLRTTSQYTAYFGVSIIVHAIFSVQMLTLIVAKFYNKNTCVVAGLVDIQFLLGVWASAEACACACELESISKKIRAKTLIVN